MCGVGGGLCGFCYRRLLSQVAPGLVVDLTAGGFLSHLLVAFFKKWWGFRLSWRGVLADWPFGGWPETDLNRRRTRCAGCSTWLSYRAVGAAMRLTALRDSTTCIFQPKTMLEMLKRVMEIYIEWYGSVRVRNNPDAWLGGSVVLTCGIPFCRDACTG